MVTQQFAKSIAEAAGFAGRLRTNTAQSLDGH
jgi:hypothetical protein